MHPLVGVLEVGGVSRPIGFYGVCAALGIAIAGGLVIRATHRARLDVGAAFAGLALVVGLGFASAWTTFGALDLATIGSLERILAGGGLVFFGAVPGGALGLYVTKRWLNLDVVRVLESALPGLAAGHAVGRFGCFLGGCCYGRPFDGAWAITYTHPLAPASIPAGVWRHPTPLYEAAGLLALGFVFALSPIGQAGSGRRLTAYVAAYCVLRFGVETLRGDLVRGVFAGLSTSQWIAALGLVLAGLAGRALTHRA